MKNSLTSRIIGGQDAPSPIPWQAGLFFNGGFVCGATIIDEETVLTTQLCVVLSFSGGTLQDKTKFKIVAGVIDISPLSLPIGDMTAQIKGISEIIVHPCLR